MQLIILLPLELIPQNPLGQSCFLGPPRPEQLLPRLQRYLGNDLIDQCEQLC